MIELAIGVTVGAVIYAIINEVRAHGLSGAVKDLKDQVLALELNLEHLFNISKPTPVPASVPAPSTTATPAGPIASDTNIENK